MKTCKKSRSAARWVRRYGPVRLNASEAYQDGIDWIKRWAKKRQDHDPKPTVWICESHVIEKELTWVRVIFLRLPDIIKAYANGEEIKMGLPVKKS